MTHEQIDLKKKMTVHSTYLMKAPKKSPELSFNRLDKKVIHIQRYELLSVAVSNKDVLSVWDKFNTMKVTKFT